MTVLERRVLELCTRAIAYPDDPKLQDILLELYRALEQYEPEKRVKKIAANRAAGS